MSIETTHRPQNGGKQASDTLVAWPPTLVATRERRGLTATSIAEVLGKSPSWVHRAEHVEGVVSGEDLTAYAQALDVTPGLLAARLPHRPPKGVHFRSNKISQRVQNSVIQHANYVGWMLNGLHEDTNLDPGSVITLPRFDIDLLGGGAVEAAQLLRSQLGINGHIKNIAEVMEAAGICIAPLPQGAEGVDAVTVTTDGPVTAVILLNTDRPVARMRHTLAHELGHLVLDGHTYDARGIDQREDDADLFAGEFLAPYQQVQPALRGITPARIDDLDALHQRWGVSMASLIRRARLNRDITENQYRYWFRVLNATGKLRDSRTVGFDVQPARIASILSTLNTAKYAPADIQRITRTTLRELQDVFEEQWVFTRLSPRLTVVG